MRKLIVQQWVTVDNVAAEEGGGLSFVPMEPLSEETDPAYKASVMGFIDSVDTLILGANTYAASKGYWPYADDQGDYGAKLNNLTKFISSSTLDEATWGDFPAPTVTSDPVTTLKELKEQGARTSGCGAACSSHTPCWRPAWSTRSGCWSVRRHAARGRVSSRTAGT